MSRTPVRGRLAPVFPDRPNDDLDPRVVILGLDGVAPEALHPDRTPNLWRLRLDGGAAPGGGRSGRPSTTHPSFASLLTGAAPRRHAIRVTTQRRGAAPGWAADHRVRVPTLFDACAAAGLRSAAVVAEYRLHRILALASATACWPPGGVLEPTTALDAHGYPTNAAVRSPLLRAAAEPSLSLVFGHLVETDTLGHRLGPAHPDTTAMISSTDAILGDTLDALSADWERSIVVVVSDHGMDERREDPIDLLADRSVRRIALDVLGDGGCALVRLRPGVPDEEVGGPLARLLGVLGWRREAPDLVLVDARPGFLFTAPKLPPVGFHGGSTTAATLAVVGGGHPAVPRIACTMTERAPRLVDWAPTFASILGLDLLATDGVDLADERAVAAEQRLRHPERSIA